MKSSAHAKPSSWVASRFLRGIVFAPCATAALGLYGSLNPGDAMAQAQEPVSVPSAGEVAAAQPPSGEELIKLKQNPVSGLRQVGLQADVSPDLPDSGRTAGAYSLQVVWPFSLNEDWKLITYSILPVLQLPQPSGQSTTVGLVDSAINLFVSPKKPSGIVWGAGPVILVPTRTDPDKPELCRAWKQGNRPWRHQREPVLLTQGADC